MKFFHNFVFTLHKFWVDPVDSVSSKEVEFERILSINVHVLEILVGKNVRGKKKFELRVSRKLFIESEILCFSKSVLKSPWRIFFFFLNDSFCNFSNKREINF